MIPFLIQKCQRDNIHNILSLGAGPCVLENCLQQMIPEPNKIVAADFDSFFISMAKKHFTSIDAEKFDFKSDDPEELQKRLGIKFDLAVFFNSSYVMDDDEFVNFFKKLKKTGIPQIIDFQSSYIPYWDMPKQYADILKERLLSIVNKFLSKPIGKDKGKFHGFSRSRGSLCNLYKESGFRIIQEIKIQPYSYVAVLSPI